MAPSNGGFEDELSGYLRDLGIDPDGPGGDGELEAASSIVEAEAERTSGLYFGSADEFVREMVVPIFRRADEGAMIRTCGWPSAR